MSAYENWRVEWAPTSQPDDPFPTWVDLTPKVETVGRPWNAQSGRPAEFGAAQPGRLALTLNNADHAFSNLTLARQIRITETIGCRTFQIFRGWLELPDISDWAEAGADQFVTVTAVDRITRLDRSRKFISTMTEYILYNGGTGLKAYYPMLESNGAIAYDKSAYGRDRGALSYFRNTAVTPALGGPAFTAGNGTVLPGDDLAAATWLPRIDAAGNYAEAASMRVKLSNPITQAGTDTITVAAWMTLRAAPSNSVVMYPVALYDGTGSILRFEWDGSPPWEAAGRAGANPAVFITSADLSVGAPMLIAVRMNLASNSLELWRHSDAPATTGLTGVAPASVDWNLIEIGDGGWTGSISHVQVYLGANAYTRAQHLAQVQAGYSGLAGQTTGQRIRTMAAYAGVPASQLNIDDGTVRMQNATLAGKSPLTPMREAETTEQGLLLADGAGELVFQDRLHRLNI